jgi:hypothetical protein
MKTPFKNPANLLTMLIMVLTMALTFSCSKEEVDDFLNGDSSSSDGSNQGGGGSSSSGGGGSSPSSSSVADIPSIGGGATQEEAFSLTAGQWAESSIAEIDGELWYKFTAIANTKYYIWLNDRYSGHKTFRSDVMIMAYDSEGEELLYSDSESDYYVDDINEDSPQTITLTSNGTVYLKVVTFERYAGLGLGFGIAYNTSSTLPGGGGGGGDILGSCIGYEHGHQVCLEFLSNYSDGASAARQECIGEDGTWSARSACPAGYDDVEEYLEEGGIGYIYYDILDEREECQEATLQFIAACSAACIALYEQLTEIGEDYDPSACLADCNATNYCDDP